MTTPTARLAWVAFAVCVAATMFNLSTAWTADNTADRTLSLFLAACTTAVTVWVWRAATRPREARLEPLGIVIPFRPGSTEMGRAGRRPEGVTIHHPDSTTTVCELAYAGHDEHGHAWHVATQFRVGIDRITIDVLPPGCYVAVPIAGSDPPH